MKQAMAKWPDVPHCYGWMGLDARGNWFMRDTEAQALGRFGCNVAGAKGWLLQHEKLIGFIQRNYEVDAAGQWFFQNGPQRVYVELEVAPWVWRVHADHSVLSHTGRQVEVSKLLIDELGHAFLLTDLGLGLVHTQDVLHLSDAMERGRWEPQSVLAAELPERFGYVLSPQAEHLRQRGA